MSPKRLVVRKDGVDVSEEITLADGRSNPFGWSSYALVHTMRVGVAEVPVTIGRLYCGEPQMTEPGYTAEMVAE